MLIIIQNYYTSDQQAKPVYDQYGRVATFLSYDEAWTYCNEKGIENYVICQQQPHKDPSFVSIDARA